MTNETTNAALTPEQIQLGTRLGNIFMPYAMRQLRAHYKDKAEGRFVHYTSAESALSIIKSKRFWMRNTNCMSDYSEVQHGFDIVGRFFPNETKGNAFIKALDACVPGAAEEAINAFGQSWNDIRFNTYIAAVSEHDDQEDLHGRLSMWRAFGGNVARVGIVLNVPLYTMATQPLNLLFSSVAYLSEDLTHRVFLEVIDNINKNCDYLKTVDRKAIVVIIFAMLLAGVVCLKHEGFREEREWRVIYAPKRSPSALMESSTEVIGGIPQVIHKIPLDAHVSASIADLDLSRLFDRLIIGPTPYPWPMGVAFIEALRQAGVADAENRVVASGIPIRM